MKIVRKNKDINILLNSETDFQTNLGWQENLVEFEEEVLSNIINPIDNYETVRYIHEPYTSSNSVYQTDIWFYFYFLDANTRYDNGLDYNLVGITTQENATLTRTTSDSFFRLEFYKTPKSGATYEPPTRLNRKLVFAKNLSLPIGEKFYYTTLQDYIYVPVFNGSNYRNKENMYLFWFQDESVLEETIYQGTETSNTFFMSAKFYNQKDLTILDFTNKALGSTVEVSEQDDLYYQVDINKTDYSYKIYNYSGGTKGSRIGTGHTGNAITFYEKGGQVPASPTPTPTPTPAASPPATPAVTPSPTPAASPGSTPAATPSLTPTMTPTMSTDFYWFELTRCDDGVTKCYTVPYNMGQLAPGRIFWSSGGHYYTIGAYYNTTGTDPGTGACANKLDGSMLAAGQTCYDTPETPGPSTTFRTAKIMAAWAFTGSTYYTQQMTDTCGLYPYQATSLGYTGLSQNGFSQFYVDEASIVPGTTYTLWDSNISGGGSVVDGGNKYYSIILGTGNTFNYVVYINTSGVMNDWHACP